MRLLAFIPRYAMLPHYPTRAVPRRVGIALVIVASGVGCGSSKVSSAPESDAASDQATPGSPDGGSSGGDSASGPDGRAAEDAAGNDGSAPTTGWDYAKIGGGGFITGGQVAADGTKFFRTDTSGGYLYDDATGTLSQIVPRNLPTGANVYLNGTGVYESLIAPFDSKLLYAAYNNALYRSTDGGNTFTATKTDFTFDSNSQSMRTYERHGQIDPQNENDILFGDQVGLYRSTDGGMTWNLASGVPAAMAFQGDTAGFSGVAFNPKSTMANGNSSEAIASTGGNYFRTIDGGNTWTDISSGGPADEPTMAEYDAHGNYFVAPSQGGIWRYGSGAWKNLQPPSDNFAFFFIDPTNDQHIVLVGHSNFAFTQSTSGGSTWGQTLNYAIDQQMSVDDIPWHTTNPHYFRANILVDPVRSVVWMPGGNQGLESIPLSALSGSPPYTDDMHGLGIENMCINTMVAAPGSKKLHAVVWDEWYAQLDRDNLVYPSIVNPMMGGISPSWGLDGCKQTPTMLARWLDGAVGSGAQYAESGWSDDDGATWNAFATLPADTTGSGDWGYGGELAYSGQDNIVVVSSNTNGVSSANGQLRMPYYTLDRGATWHPVTLPTAWTQTNVSEVHSAYYLNRQILVADYSQLGRFYFLVEADDPNFRGIYRTDDGGATWTRTSAIPGTQDYAIWQYNAHLKSPVTNHLWMTAGEEGSGSPVGTGQLFRSTDGGTTFAALPDVLEPFNIGFGAPAQAGGYPVLFMSGYYKGQPGMWMTANASDASPTWVSIGSSPNDQYSGVNFIEGDPDVPGRVWVATGCAGVQFGEFGSLLP
ncbi:MAG: hypothetical protein ACLP1X_31940 [Polyangiaceae bacterium]